MALQSNPKHHHPVQSSPRHHSPVLSNPRHRPTVQPQTLPSTPTPDITQPVQPQISLSQSHPRHQRPSPQKLLEAGQGIVLHRTPNITMCWRLGGASVLELYCPSVPHYHLLGAGQGHTLCWGLGGAYSLLGAGWGICLLVHPITLCWGLGVTWGKVVSLYAVAGALAVDCVRHGHPAIVHTIVDCMGEFVRKSLVSWLRRRGGWADITKCVVNTDPSFHSHWLVSAACSWGHYLKAVFFHLLREK
ncbi:hypothetical protein ACEWY4_015133 [Coilia grayii]|uniref:Bcl-2 Bcl-2 homology region 1-3 domain-containing protein n=1 Tax=Coilia grayii TaxID=363190 RepID=A0ABD1JUB3_9TELE